MAYRAADRAPLPRPRLRPRPSRRNRRRVHPRRYRTNKALIAMMREAARVRDARPFGSYSSVCTGGSAADALAVEVGRAGAAGAAAAWGGGVSLTAAG